MYKILITGGSGFLGSHLIPHLKNKGHHVSVLSRKIQNGISTYLWDPEKHTIDKTAFTETDTVIHLAGAGLADHRWTANYKREIIDSRIKTADLLFETLKQMPSHKVKTFISASAIGYYGDTGDTWVEEDFHGQGDFLGEVCLQWERSARRFEELGIRVVILRIGLVLANDGGLLPVVKKPLRYFIGAPLGNGRQYMSWIHVDDLASMFAFMIENPNLRGIFNAVAPGPVTHLKFMKSLAKSMKRPLLPIHVPSFALHAALGEKAELVLHGQRVSSEKIRLAGYQYLHSDLEKVLEELV